MVKYKLLFWKCSLHKKGGSMIKKIALAVFCFILFVSANAFAKSNDIAKIGSDAVIEDGTTVNDVAIIFGDLVVNGVARNVAVIGGDLKVGPTGKILGDSAVIFGKILKSPDAEINNNVVEIRPVKIFSYNFEFPILAIFALGLLGLVIFSAVFVIILLLAYLFTGRIGRTSFYIQTNLLRSLLYGFCFALMIVPVTLFLLVSIIGIPLIPVFIFAVFITSLFGYTVMCQLFGLKFFNIINKPNQSMIWEVIVGFIIFCILILIPYIGWFIKILIWMTGFGATIVTKFGKTQQ